MRQVQFDKLKKILCLGAHSDDIEIGCGGTILKLTEEHPGLEVMWVVFSAEGARHAEASASAAAFLKKAGKAKVVVKDFRGSFFPFQGEAIKSYFETLKPFQPDVVFTHYRDDRHQDHRVLSDLAWNTYRDHLILEYEIPKYDGDLGVPNAFVPLDAKIARRKARLLKQVFASQRSKRWFTEETFLGLMRLRGIECGARGGYAEAFHARKLRLL